MKTLSFLLLLLPVFSISQTFNDQPYPNAQELASKENKILIVLLYSASCLQCNEVADKGLSSPEVKQRLEKNEFIAVAYKKGQNDWSALKEKFNATADAISLVFISPSGNLLHKMEGSTTFGRTYIGQMDRAVNNLKDEKAYLEFEKAYLSGSRNPQLLEQLLNYRMQMGKPTDDVLDAYTKALPADSLSSLSALQKIARFAPELDSYSDSILHANVDRFNEAWFRMPLQERVNINNRIIAKTKATAIAKKDKRKIMRVANFTSAITRDPYQQRRMPLITYMDFYKALGDTTGYFSMANAFMETLVMKISPDSVKQADIARKEQMSREAMQQPSEVPAGTTGPMTVQRSFTFSPATQYFANDLNNTAFEYYKTTSNINHLKNAVRWSARSLEFIETSAFHDTYARLLYKTGSRDSAIVHQQKAIELEKKRGFPATEFEKVLGRMKNGEIRIDEY